MPAQAPAGGMPLAERCTSPLDSRLPVMVRSVPITDAEPFPRAFGPGRALGTTGGPPAGLREGTIPTLPASMREPSFSGFFVNIDTLLQEILPLLPGCL